MALFPIEVNCISVLAFDIEGQHDCWKRHYSSVGEVIDGLREVGVITALEASELQTDLDFVDGFPLFRGCTEREDLEDAGFFRIVDSKPN
jgi:hypothetical protein